MITLQHFHPLDNTVAENLWTEGHTLHLGPNSVDAVSRHNPQVHAWVAFVDRAPAGIWACRFAPGHKRVWNLLAYVRPEFRGLGVYRQLAAAAELALAAAGYTEIWSNIINGPEAAGMLAANASRGSVIAQFVVRRPLTQA
jgi:GNAT superfamily N-acetyltransferase